MRIFWASFLTSAFLSTIPIWKWLLLFIAARKKRVNVTGVYALPDSTWTSKHQSSPVCHPLWTWTKQGLKALLCPSTHLTCFFTPPLLCHPWCQPPLTSIMPPPYWCARMCPCAIICSEWLDPLWPNSSYRRSVQVQTLAVLYISCVLCFPEWQCLRVRSRRHEAGEVADAAR